MTIAARIDSGTADRLIDIRIQAMLRKPAATIERAKGYVAGSTIARVYVGDGKWKTVGLREATADALNILGRAHAQVTKVQKGGR